MSNAGVCMLAKTEYFEVVCVSLPNCNYVTAYPLVVYRAGKGIDSNQNVYKFLNIER